MRFSLNTLSILLGFILAFPLVADDHAASEVNTTTPANCQPKVDPVLFREIFNCFLDKKYTEQEKHEMMFLPTKEMEESTEAKTPEEFLKKKLAVYSKLTPTDLYNQGVKTPNLTGINCADFEAKLRAKPLTIVLVPGIFGEFIDNKAFQEVFDNNSQFDKEDQIYTSSVNGKDGKPLFTFALLNTPPMSFESMGDITEKGALFSKRLENYIKKNPGGQSANLAILGYSRGTTTGLEMLAQANAMTQKPEWLNRTRDLVSLGGVAFGSDLGDDALNPTSVTYKQLHALYDLANELIESNDRADFWKNNWAWTKFVAKEIAAGHDISPFIRMAMQVKHADIRGDAELIINMAKRFGIDHFNDHYVENIQQFKSFVKELKTGTEQLSTDARSKWWAAKEHTLPNNVKFLGVAGVMSQPGTPLGNSKVLYDLGKPDEATQASSNRDFKKASGTDLNDGQMSMIKMQVWPEYASLLNPDQKPIDYHLLGVTGAAHWGLALRSVVPPSKNPFPREALLKAIAASVAMGMDECH